MSKCTYNMNSGLETVFTSLIKQQEMSEAIDFITSINLEYIPSSSIIQTIIFDVLMKCTDVRVLSEAKAYLLNLLEVYPPFDDVHRKYYLSALCSSRGLLSELWPIFSHIVSSCLCHYGVNVTEVGDDGGPELIKYPNCNFLLDLYVKIFRKDLEFFLTERRIYATYKKTLLTYLFWPSASIGGVKHNSNILLKWINDIYKSLDVESKSSVLDLLHEMQCLMIKCVVDRKYNLSEIEALNSPYLAEIVEDIMTLCKDSFKSLNHFNVYICSLSLKYLQARISEKVITKLLSRSKTLHILTLKDIVYKYVFSHRPKENCANTADGKSIKSKRVKQQNMLLKKIKMSSRGGTKLHELCKNNKYGDLKPLLSIETNVNVKNYAGDTPLHEACLAKAHFCVKVLITSSGQDGKQPVDLMAVNKDGQTPLHYAVMMNDLAIAKTLLINGGAQLLKLADFKKCKPHDYAASSEMKDLLEKYKCKSTADVHAVSKKSSTWKAPTLDCYKDYSIYLHALNYLLCLYCEIFQIYTYIFKESPEPVCHETKKCYHYIKDDFGEVAACSDDVEMLQNVPNLINSFMKSVTKHAQELEITIDMELIPLRTFVSSLAKPVKLE